MISTVHSVTKFKGNIHDYVIDITFEYPQRNWWSPLSWLDYIFDSQTYPKGRFKFIGSSTVWHYLDGPYRNATASTYIEKHLYDIWSAHKRGLPV